MAAGAPCCEKCQHWKPERGGKYGECRRFPPTRDSLGDPKSPRTPADHFCSEFKEKIAP